MKQSHKNIAWDLLRDAIFSLPFPKHIYIEPTNDCRLNCSICPNKADNSEIGYLGFGLFKKIINDISPYTNVESIALHKNGEPLLHPELPRMIRYIKKKDPFVNVSFSTSGIPFNKRLSKTILSAMPDEICVSFGNFPFDSGKFSKKGALLKNIKNLLAMRRALGRKKPKLTLRFIKENASFHLLDAKRTKWSDICDEIEVRPYHTWCGYFRRTYRIPEKRTPCLSLWTTLAINWDGDVSICSLDYAKEGIVGNIKKSSLKDIWEGEKLRLFRKRHLYDYYKDLRPCEFCTEWRHNVKFWTRENTRHAKIQSGKWIVCKDLLE